MSRTHRLISCGLLLVAAACVDRPAPVESGATPGGAATGTIAGAAGPELRPDRLARLFAGALRSAEFRGYLKAALDSSPFAEHKLPLQRFLAAAGGRARRALAEQNGTTEDDVAREAAAAIPLEVYLPVPAHRAAWPGDENVLVATATKDREPPVAFSPDGRRSILDPDTPPATPVIAVVPVETDFDPPPARMQCLDCFGDTTGSGGSGSGSGGTTGPVGLFMTKSHFDDDYEGWLKGNPEFEIHVLGQQGSSDSLTDYQCAGEHAGGPYAFDQNSKDWTGSVLLFSQTQLDSYKAAHPGQSLRILALEDDDTACKIVTDKNNLSQMFQLLDTLYTMRTGGRDSLIAQVKRYKNARALRNILAFLASLIKTNDDVIGTAIEDQVIGTIYSGYNWIVKGQNNITHGWLNLEMR